jgi:hypothetical protein
MPPSVKCPRRIAPAAAMVADFKKKRKNTNKTQLLPSVLTVDQRKKAIVTQDPLGTLYSRPQGNKPQSNPYATSQVGLSYILSYQT